MTLTAAETTTLSRLDGQAAPMLAQVQTWASINSGSRNLAGLARMAEALAEAFAPLGPVTLRDPAPVDAVAADGAIAPIAHGRNLHLSVRPEARKR